MMYVNQLVESDIKLSDEENFDDEENDVDCVPPEPTRVRPLLYLSSSDSDSSDTEEARPDLVRNTDSSNLVQQSKTQQKKR